MHLSRLGWAIVAGVVALLTTFVVAELEIRLIGSVASVSLWATLVGAGTAVMALADRFGLIESAYAGSPLHLRDDSASAAAITAASWQTHFNRGRAAGTEGDVSAAVRHFEEAVRVAPDEPYPHYELGYSLSLLGDVEAALTHFRRTNELAEGFFLVQMEIYLCEAFLSGLLDSDDMVLVRRIQWLTDCHGSDSSEAVSLSRRLIVHVPTCALGYYYLGKALVIADPPESERALRQCIAREPDETTAIDAWAHIGVHRRNAGDVETARAIWLELRSRYPNNPHVKPVEAFFLQLFSSGAV